ncbi:SH3 domain protein [Oesophagostomum dentatum]|uniref:SH3 domain protein n=1 Tax=Oesophagostomum dentatum TaxID=61180 RepID=A0A0B1TDB3_OESDE|nr:SH3 domain protein [Oesophagostomum dentatum]
MQKVWQCGSETRYCVDFAEEIGNRAATNAKTPALSPSGAGFAVKAIYDYTAADKDEYEYGVSTDIVIHKVWQCGSETRYCVDFAEEIGNRAATNAKTPALSPSGAAGFAVKAIYDYTAADKDEVSFLEGDIIVNCEKVDDGWMTGTVQRTLQWGMLPANYVQPHKLPTGLARIKGRGSGHP